MTSGQIWENVYVSGAQHNVAPYQEVFSFFARHLGAGNNLLFASWAFGCKIHGIDVSESAIKVAEERFRTFQLPQPTLNVGSVPADWVSGTNVRLCYRSREPAT